MAVIEFYYRDIGMWRSDENYLTDKDGVFVCRDEAHLIAHFKQQLFELFQEEYAVEIHDGCIMYSHDNFVNGGAVVGYVNIDSRYSRLSYPPGKQGKTYIA